MQSKKQLILWVLNILNSESDECRPITQTKIADVISEVYTRRIEVDIPFNNETLDFKALAIKAIPITKRYIEVFRGYIDC